ncbi:hypothetical protein M422DRAFT_49597 [Sphaerobolus stellatus SS14]|uniref:Uncharacterized protein n=1 Tax=Sphaerobolus stellatus (strain SS14) TaxID=990650 RepID=A0A0C9U8T5_SPHS4|nr:hypothetical protein M422DRAFT_49597 [Sphaerobolus stellatus SS14]
MSDTLLPLLELVVTAIQDIRIIGYNTFAALSIIVYDRCLTHRQEYDYLFKYPVCKFITEELFATVKYGLMVRIYFGLKYKLTLIPIFKECPSLYIKCRLFISGTHLGILWYEPNSLRCFIVLLLIHSQLCTCLECYGLLFYDNAYGSLLAVEAAALFTIYTIAFKAYKVAEVNPIEGIVPNCSAIASPAQKQFVISYL